MQKHLSKLYGILLILAALFFFNAGNNCYAVQSGIPVMTEETTGELTYDNPNSKVKDIDIEPINTDRVKKSVVPDTKKEGKKLIGLFLKTMFLVAFCAILLYVILLFIKKFYGSDFIPTNEECDNAEMLELNTPETKSDALKSFLNRTR